MFAVAYDCPPDPSAVMAFAALVLAVPVWFVAALAAVYLVFAIVYTVKLM